MRRVAIRYFLYKEQGGTGGKKRDGSKFGSRKGRSEPFRCKHNYVQRPLTREKKKKKPRRKEKKKTEKKKI